MNRYKITEDGFVVFSNTGLAIITFSNKELPQLMHNNVSEVIFELYEMKALTIDQLYQIAEVIDARFPSSGISWWSTFRPLEAERMPKRLKALKVSPLKKIPKPEWNYMVDKAVESELLYHQLQPVKPQKK